MARNSLHMEGRAIDVRLPGVALAELRDAALSLRAGGVGFYPREQFVHLDTGRVRPGSAADGYRAHSDKTHHARDLASVSCGFDGRMPSSCLSRCAAQARHPSAYQAERKPKETAMKRLLLLLLLPLAAAAYAQPCPDKNIMYWQAFPPGRRNRHLRVATSKWC